MNTAIHYFILLTALTVICTSQVIKTCLCVKTNKAVKPSLIAGVMQYGPRPYCNKKEVIVILKDNSARCLDPNHRFTQAVLQALQMRRKVQAAKMNTTNPETTTISATLAPTSS